MKTVNAATNKNNTGTYYIDIYNDIFETKEEAEVVGVSGKVIVDNLFVGSRDDMKKAAFEKWESGK